eukprot:GFUD01019315.1.p1 GENE.GFUD01019315.1~~GFUD01019315.1.p1  ORF type:complete len:229 (+),score=64.68 GFUD01019315.1:90-776(+)
MSGESGDRLSRWKGGYWDVDNTPWHKTEPNESLVKHWYKATQGRQGLRVLFPLCGASVDLNWLYRQNHSVVGVEGVRKGVEKLFTEADVEYDVTKVDEIDSWKFQTQDKRLTVYLADFLGMTNEVAGTFDAVFDRGALEAMEESDRPAYISTIQGLLKKDFVYILSGFDYKAEQKTGPPRPLPQPVVEQLFGQFADVEILTQEKEEERAIKWNIPNLIRNTYLIKNKK